MSTEPQPDESGLTTHWICERYEATRARLPAARFPDRSDRAERLLDLVDEFDVFVLDAFGVLNVGTTVVPGALETIERIQAAGKRAIVLTNGATLPESAIQKKFEHWGYRFPPGDIVASRRILARALERDTVPSVWGIAAPAHAMVDELPGRPLRLLDDREAYDRVDGFILLSSGDWTEARQRLLAESLRQRPRPLWVANPDLVAPRETGFSFEPGYYAHRLADQLGLEPVFFGKPFTNAFDAVWARLGGAPDRPDRVAMVGDSLHTDILGGAAAGISTVLVSDLGLFKDQSPEPYIERYGIVPNVIVATT